MKGWGAGGGVAALGPPASPARDITAFLLGMNRLSAGRVGLSREPVEHIVMATSLWVCLDYAVKWGNACDVTSRKQTGEREVVL